MRKVETVIRRFFADSEELTVHSDPEGIASIKGLVIVEGISFRISISRNTTGNTQPLSEGTPPKYKPLYTGTISTLDPASTGVMLSEKKRRAKEEKGLSYTNKDIYASVKYRCDSSDPEVIAAAIHRRILALIEQDKSQLIEAIKKAMTPEQLTLPFACDQYVFDFLRRTYPSSSPENNTKKSKQLQRVLSRFPATPINKLAKRQVNSILTEIHATDEAIKLCYLFVEYLLQMRLCRGSNPFTPPETKAQPANTAFQRQELGDAVFERMFELLNKSLSATNMVIALQASGFPLADIRTLTWGDIEFVAGYKDFYDCSYSPGLCSRVKA